ncbi:MAG: UvrB/UvrC motif-containing protein [Patescibacteria group bacterium]
MFWANFLHIYQPPTQKKHWVEKITSESYRQIVHGLKKHPRAKLTLNINAILCELLAKHNGKDVLDDLRLLLRRGQLELTGSAKYHPLLPTLPEKEIRRQIKLNTGTSRKFFGNLYKPQGFFPPEMGFSTKVARVVSSLGFRWIIVDELSFPDRSAKIDYSVIYQVKGLPNFSIYFRERKMSYKILSGQMGTGELLINGLGDRLKKNEYLLTAMDGETFGHHRPGMEHLLFEIYQSKRLKTVTISELSGLFDKNIAVSPRPSTWALMEKDLENNAPFSRWDDPGNVIHKKQWELTRLAIKTAHRLRPGQVSYRPVRQTLDSALHSDQYWWASAKPWWSLEMIEAGAKELRDVVLLNNKATADEKQKAEKLYRTIIFTGFQWQRDGTVEKLSREEDEEVRQRTDEGIPQLPKKEIDKIIINLTKEMRSVAVNYEFERAAQLRDRINELKRYVKKNSG